MYSLIVWHEENPPSTSVVEAANIKWTGRNGPSVRWMDGKFYPAKIIKQSHNKKQLESLEISTTGKIFTPEKRRSHPDAIMVKQRQLKNEEKKTKKNQVSTLNDIERSIINGRTIFDSNGENEDSCTDTGEGRSRERTKMKRKKGAKMLVNMHREDDDESILDKSTENLNNIVIDRKKRKSNGNKQKNKKVDRIEGKHKTGETESKKPNQINMQEGYDSEEKDNASDIEESDEENIYQRNTKKVMEMHKQYTEEIIEKVDDDSGDGEKGAVDGIYESGLEEQGDVYGKDGENKQVNEHISHGDTSKNLRRSVKEKHKFSGNLVEKQVKVTDNAKNNHQSLLRNESSDNDDENTVEDVQQSVEEDDSGSDNEHRENTNTACKICPAYPEVNEQMIALQAHLLEFMRLQYNAQKSQDHQDQKSNVDAYANLTTNYTTPTTFPGVGKIEIIPGCKVWINGSDLNHIKRMFRCDSKEMVRRLMKAIVGEKYLANMTTTGRNGFEKIPDDVYIAVESYTNTNVTKSQRLERQAYNRTLTLMTNVLRRKKNDSKNELKGKIQTKTPGTSEPGTSKIQEAEPQNQISDNEKTSQKLDDSIRVKGPLKRKIADTPDKSKAASARSRNLISDKKNRSYR